jgi:hypothetical protein
MEGNSIMKKVIFIVLTYMLILFISACSVFEQSFVEQNNSENSINTSQDQDPVTLGLKQISSLSTDYENALPGLSQLAIGTIKLEQSANPLSKEQASELSFLWKALLNLSESETVASAEIQAVISQIEDNYYEEQLETIKNMKLTSDDMADLSKELGLSLGKGGGFGGQIDPELRETAQASRKSGQGMGAPDFEGMGVPGGVPGMGGDFGQGIDQGESTTLTKGSNTEALLTPMNIGLINAVIDYLQSIQ